MFENYELQIGTVFNEKFQTVPVKTIRITKDQFLIIEQLANIKKDFSLETIYIINDLEFKMVPAIEFGINTNTE